MTVQAQSRPIPARPQSENQIPENRPLSIARLLVVLARYLPYYKPFLSEIILLTVLLPLAGSILVLIVPLCTRLILDVAFPRGDVTLLMFLAAAGCAAVLAERILMVLVRATVGSHLRVRILGALGAKFYRNMLGLNMRFHRNTSVGEKIFRCDTDLIDISEMLGIQLPLIVQYAMQFVVTIVAMCLIDWRPVVVATLGVPVFFLIAQWLFNFYRRIDLWQRVTGQKVTARLEESLSAPEVVYSHGARGREIVRYYRELATYSVANMLYWFMIEVSIFLVWPTGLPAIASSFVIGIVGSILMVQGELTLGEYTALTALIVQALIPIGILINNYQTLRLRMVVAERILDLLDSKERMPIPKHGKTLSPFVGRIEFRDVSFSYVPGKPVLNGVSFTVEPGGRIALVGPSGIGKSTLMNLILRFYDPDSGSILVDGVDLRELDIAQYRANIGMVLQEPILFDGTIRDNVLYGAEPSPENFENAIRTSHLDEMVENFPLGFETPVIGGLDLSLGEKQRISLARCIARDPRLLLLDEPISLLDPASGQSILDAIERSVEGRTAVFISHDLLSLRDVDKIIVLKDGVVTEEGTHDQLMEREGLFRDLWDMQVNRRKPGEELP
ncbi:MAG: ABC transporter ATP-binding protein [Candidatus Omnitrophica bacterium]|nr:ABC transporter ATP-binding protein [Candidatus Omnitrophota bacterium]